MAVRDLLEHSLLNFCAQPDETLRGKRRSSYGIRKDKKVANFSNMAIRNVRCIKKGKKWKPANFVPVGFCMSGVIVCLAVLHESATPVL